MKENNEWWVDLDLDGPSHGGTSIAYLVPSKLWYCLCRERLAVVLRRRSSSCLWQYRWPHDHLSCHWWIEAALSIWRWRKIVQIVNERTTKSLLNLCSATRVVLERRGMQTVFFSSPINDSLTVRSLIQRGWRRGVRTPAAAFSPGTNGSKNRSIRFRHGIRNVQSVCWFKCSQCDSQSNVSTHAWGTSTSRRYRIENILDASKVNKTRSA